MHFQSECSKKNIHQKPILILDFGSQYTQLIARRIRELGVYSEIHSYDMDVSLVKAFNPAGIILSGGPDTVTSDGTPGVPPYVFDMDIPVLGICYGMQAMAAAMGGQVSSSANKEYGAAEVNILEDSLLFEGIVDEVRDDQKILNVWMSHGDKVVKCPNDFIISASTPSAPIAAMAHKSRPWFGLQFHPEVTHTHQGKRIFEHFVHRICKSDPVWTPTNILQSAVQQIKQQVGEDQVILGLSGGVDSSVVAALLSRAIGDQLTCVFVDNGLLRDGEAQQVRDTFSKNMGVNLVSVDASKDFLTALESEADPEQKRKIIGRVFVEIFEQESNKLTNAKWLAQGTIYPDVIESAAAKTGKATVIKSHHNVGGLPAHMKLKLLEPLRELFKDEVRELGLELGLPYDMVYRHPFPGPGLGVRILGEVKDEYANILRKADRIFIDELKAAELYYKVSQAFCVFLPVKSVGVVGDARQYEYVIALRAVETIDFMTARWAHLPYEFLEKVSNRIINEVAGVSRVTYDISSKPPATIEWE